MVARPLSASGDRRSTPLYSQSAEMPEIARFKVGILIAELIRFRFI